MAFDLTFRPAIEADLEPGSRIFNRAMNELAQRRGYERGDRPPEVFIGPQRHVMAHDGDRCFVAESDGAVVAYSSAITRGDAWYFSALFVDPDAQGQGIGRRLFELSAASWPARRMTIVDAIQPISTGLYSRNGLLPMTPILGFGGRPEARTPVGVEASSPTGTELAELDRAAYGFDRAVDHAFWGSQAELTLWRRDGAPLAYSYLTETGLFGPLAGRDDSSAAIALAAALAARSEVSLEIPGSCPDLVAVALAAGLRFVNPPGLLLHSRPARLPTSLVISGYWLL